MDNELFDCDICYEQFDETGSHVPLVLPCGHTLCRQCVESLKTHVCPTCKWPLNNGEGDTVTLPRNNWLIRCLVARQSPSSSQTQTQNQKHSSNFSCRQKVPIGAPPKVAAAGQRVLFKQLDRACARGLESGDMSSPVETSEELQQGQALKSQDRSFLLNLSRICKEKKAQDSNFDQKRFVKEGLIMKFGEAKAKVIIHQVFDRIKVLQGRRV